MAASITNRTRTESPIRFCWYITLFGSNSKWELTKPKADYYYYYYYRVLLIISNYLHDSLQLPLALNFNGHTLAWLTEPLLEMRTHLEMDRKVQSTLQSPPLQGAGCVNGNNRGSTCQSDNSHTQYQTQATENRQYFVSNHRQFLCLFIVIHCWHGWFVLHRLAARQMIRPRGSWGSNGSMRSPLTWRSDCPDGSSYCKVVHLVESRGAA